MANFTYVSFDDERTAGLKPRPYKSVQAWKTTHTNTVKQESEYASVQKEILNNLEQAGQGKKLTPTNKTLVYSSNEQAAPQQTKESFEFKDIVDVINPLQHLPVVGSVYRGLTGDELHPASQIIGGGLYGGPIGAIVGTANAISQMETGKDLTGLALSMTGIAKETPTPLDKNNPEQQLNHIAKTLDNQKPLEDIPGSAMAFVNLSEPNKAYQKIEIAEGRTAGKMIIKRNVNSPQITHAEQKFIPAPPDFKDLPPIEKITSLHVNAMPPRQQGI